MGIPQLEVHSVSFPRLDAEERLVTRLVVEKAVRDDEGGVTVQKNVALRGTLPGTLPMHFGTLLCMIL